MEDEFASIVDEAVQEAINEAYFKFKKTLDINPKISKRVTLYNFGLSDQNSTEKKEKSSDAPKSVHVRIRFRFQRGQEGIEYERETRFGSEQNRIRV